MKTHRVTLLLFLVGTNNPDNPNHLRHLDDVESFFRNGAYQTELDKVLPVRRDLEAVRHYLLGSSGNIRSEFLFLIGCPDNDLERGGNRINAADNHRVPLLFQSRERKD